MRRPRDDLWDEDFPGLGSKAVAYVSELGKATFVETVALAGVP